MADKRFKIVVALSIVSLLLLTAAWLLSNTIASLQPDTAQAQQPLITL